ncbi:aspartate/glutamate racemase family protein [Streptomyces turgidiscabies]|uniref:aspartate/glutamate racemase family protein n=1 Tax=Streptomyces TaxID=1883 RepID=UPI0005CA51C5|nr:MULTISPECIES: aspartate/glutamate racemase family protein [Streptomyces]MDX3491653.1 aspartate/glutamate racemase family protein [Streptomyces turgidiscabies]
MLALLHTSPLHVPVFDALRDEDHPGLELVHFVHEDLLTRARAEGPEAVAGDVRAVLDRAVAEGADAVLCTCSSIGGVAEVAAEEVGVPVLRVDRPMAAAAVAVGPRVVVVATSESTFGPTVALVEEEARRAGLPADVRTLFVDGAWALFQAGDTEGYGRSVADVVDSIPGDSADAIILAQASMTPAQPLTTTTVPVLSSPRPGLAAGAAAARAAEAGRR